MFWDPRKAGSRPHSPRNRRPPPRNRMCPSRVPPGFYLAGRIGRAVGSKAGLLCKFWQEGPIASVFVTNFPILAVIKSSKVGFQPFPKQMRVGTYPSRPQGHLPRAFAKGICQGHLLRVAFSGSLRTGSIGALCAVAKSVSAIGFLEGAQDFIAGWSSPVARQAHNLKVIGSNPIPATKLVLLGQKLRRTFFICRGVNRGRVNTVSTKSLAV